MNALADQLSQDVFDIIASPTAKLQDAGLRLLHAMLEQKLLDVDTVVPSNGKKLFESLVEHILKNHKGLHPMFSGEAVEQWIGATEGRAFSLPTSEGGWLPFKVLETIAAWDSKQKRDKDIKSKVLDGWLASVLPLLPASAWQGEDASRALSHAFALKMNTGAALIWDHTPIARRVSRVAHALPSSSVGWAWKRFLSEGGDPLCLVDGRPLWQLLLTKFSMNQKQSADSLAGALEQWMFQGIVEGKAPPGVPQFVEKLFRKRAESASFSGEDWMKMLEAVPLDWASWKQPSGQAWWKAPAHRCAGVTWFEALQSSPAILSQLDGKEVVAERFNVLFEQIASRATPADGTSRLLPIFDHVKQHGWPPGAPFVLKFAVKSLPKTFERKQLREMALLSPAAWWGPEQDRASVERAAVDNLVKVIAIDVQDWRFIAQTWLTATQCDCPGHWLEVVGTLVQALCSGSAELQELDGLSPDTLCMLCQQPDALEVLGSFSRRASKKQLPAFERFIKRVQLESALVPAPVRPKAPRF